MGSIETSLLDYEKTDRLIEARETGKIMNLPQTAVSFPVWAIVLLTGCSTTESDWKHAREANTVSSYANFLRAHPQGPHVEDARAAIQDVDWESARAKHTLADYEGYLLRYKGGKHALEARQAVEAIYDAFFDPDKSLSAQTIKVTGLVEFTAPDSRIGLVDLKTGRAVPSRPEARLKTTHGEFEILLDTPGEKMVREANGKTVEVQGLLSGKATNDLTTSLSTPFSGTAKLSRVPELKVEEWRPAP